MSDAIKQAAQVNRVQVDQRRLADALTDLVEEMNLRTKKLDNRIDETLSTVATAANDLKRIQMANIDTAMTGFRALVIRHCMDKGDD